MSDRHRRYYAGGGLGSTAGLGYHPSSSGSGSSAALMGRYQKSSTTASALDRLRTHLSPVGGYYKPLIRGLGSGGRRDRDLDDVSMSKRERRPKSERCAKQRETSSVPPDTDPVREPQFETLTHFLGIQILENTKSSHLSPAQE